MSHVSTITALLETSGHKIMGGAIYVTVSMVYSEEHNFVEYYHCATKCKLDLPQTKIVNFPLHVTGVGGGNRREQEVKRQALWGHYVSCPTIVI